MVSAAGAAGLVAFGALEGYAFFRTGLVAPTAIADQMGFSSFIVLKLFVSAVGTSMVTQAAMSKISPEKFDQSRQMTKTDAGFPRAVGGCFVLGCGMALAGCGPTLLPAQIAAGVPAAFYTAAGSLAGGAVFAVIEKSVFGDSSKCENTGAKTAIDQKSGMSYASIAGPAGLAMLAATCGIEAFWPHSYDVQNLGTHVTNPWLPIAAGCVIGLNQIPLRYIASKGQGGSTSVMNIISTASAGVLAPGYQMSSFAAASQFLYVWIGTALGAFVAKSADAAYEAQTGFSPMRSFIGGALMIFGARIAMGCTCGHGISGMSELSVQSIAGAMAIFAGGIATALCL